MLSGSKLLCAAIPALMVFPAWGGLVNPGQSLDLSDGSSAVESVGGDVVKRRFATFDLRGSDAMGRVVAGVARDASTQQLSFFYQFVNYNREHFTLDSLRLDGFDGFSTDVVTLAPRQQEPPMAAQRSSDGSTLNIQFNPDGAGMEPGSTSVTLVIRTNATEFDDRGTLNVDGIASFREEDESATGLLRSFAPAGIAFEPPSDTPPVMAPLPPAVWTGLAGMAGTIAYVLRTRQSVRA